MTQLLPLLEMDSVNPCAGYAGCLINERISLAERHIQPTPEVTPKTRALYAQAELLFRRHFPPRKLHAWTRERVLECAPANRKKRIANAYMRLDRDGEPSDFSRVKAFIKWEKFSDDLSDPLQFKAPRLIQHRSDEYCYELARYLKPLEHKLFQSYDGKKVPRSKRKFIKGMNSFQVATNLRKASRFPNPVWINADHSRFDAHLNNELRRVFRKYVKDSYPGDQYIERLMRMQEVNKGKTRNGIKYSVRGTMMSGEYNTSLEDCFINYMILLFVFQNVDCEIRVNGDDSVICLDRSELHKVNLGGFGDLAFKTKTEIVFDFSQIDFCQCKPVELSSGHWRMVRNPFRVFERTAYTIKNYPDLKGYQSLAGAIGLGELACNNGIPMLQSYALFMIQAARGRFSKHDYDEYMARRPEPHRSDLGARVSHISTDARNSFYAAFGVSPAEQISFERWIG